MVIYIDVLIFTNTIINYCILSSTQKFLRIVESTTRVVIASAVSSLFSFIVYLESLPFLLSLTLKLLSACVMCLIAFKFRGLRLYIKVVATTFFLTYIFCAIIIVYLQTFNPKNIMVINDIVYFDIDPLVLITASVTIYIVIRVSGAIINNGYERHLVKLKITLNNKQFICTAMIDTGNCVREPFSGSPVIITESSVLKDYIPTKTRVVPYNNTSGNSIMIATKAEQIEIDNRRIEREVYIGILNREIDQHIKAIINSEIIR